MKLVDWLQVAGYVYCFAGALWVLGIVLERFLGLDD
jgi:hypothetical protein